MNKLWIFWIYGDKHGFSVLKSLLSKGSKNPAYKFWYHYYTYLTLNPGEPKFSCMKERNA